MAFSQKQFDRIAATLDEQYARVDGFRHAQRVALIQKLVDIEDDDSLHFWKWLQLLEDIEERAFQEICAIVPEWFWEREQDIQQAAAERRCPEC